MKIQGKLQSWLHHRGVLSAVTRVCLASAALAPFLLIWTFTLAVAAFSFVAFFKRGPSPEELFTIVICGIGLLALPTLLVIHLMARLEQRPFVSLGLRFSPQSLKEFLSGLVLGIIIVSIGFLWDYWSGIFRVAWNPPPLTPALLGEVLLLALGWFGVAFWEELYFRGYLLQAWASGIGIVPAVLATSISFGAVHVMTYGLHPLIVFGLTISGLVLAVLYLKTKSLWAPIGMHFVNNFWSTHILSIPWEREIRFPFLKVDGQPIQVEAPHFIFQTELVGEKRFVDLFTWEGTLVSVLFHGVIAFLIWRLPWLRPHPEMEALWQQYVPIAQPWAHLKAWWAKRRSQKP